MFNKKFILYIAVTSNQLLFFIFKRITKLLAQLTEKNMRVFVGPVLQRVDGLWLLDYKAAVTKHICNTGRFQVEGLDL